MGAFMSFKVCTTLDGSLALGEFFSENDFSSHPGLPVRGPVLAPDFLFSSPSPLRVSRSGVVLAAPFLACSFSPGVDPSRRKQLSAKLA